MNNYSTKTTVEERTNQSDLRADASLDEQSRPVPTNTLGVNARPQGVSMTDSKSVPFVVTALLIIAVIMLVVWLL